MWSVDYCAEVTSYLERKHHEFIKCMLLAHWAPQTGAIEYTKLGWVTADSLNLFWMNVPLGNISMWSSVDVWPFVCVEVTAHSSYGEEGGGTIRGTVVLQEARHIQSEVHRPWEVVWVCIHPANDLGRASKIKRERRGKDWSVRSACQSKMEFCLSEAEPICWKPSKLKLFVPGRPQLPFACLSVATWRQLCFSPLSNPCTILQLMTSIWGSHILGLLSDWTKLLSPKYVVQSLPHFRAGCSVGK